MSFHEVQFPVDISYGSRGGPGHNTGILELDSGAESRIGRWASARHRYNAAYGVKRLSQLAEVKKFVLARKGSLYGFRYKDFQDFASTSDGMTTATGGLLAVDDQDQVIGTGDGTTTEFQLVKKYVSGPTTVLRTIEKPVAGTVRVALDTTEQMAGWSVDTTTGIVLFSVAPTLGVLVKAGFEFDVPCRFGESVDDQLDMLINSYDEGDAGELDIIEDVDELGGDDEFYYGGALNHGTISANQNISIRNGRAQAFAPSVSSLKVILPSADTLPAGGPYFYIFNNGAHALDVRTSADALVVNIAISGVAEIILTIDGAGIKSWIGF